MNRTIRETGRERLSLVGEEGFFGSFGCPKRLFEAATEQRVERKTGRAMSIRKRTLGCQEVVDLFGEYIDDELNPELKECVGRHIEECPCCEEFEKSYRFVIQAASLLKPREVDMPLGARNRLRNVLNQRLGLTLSMMDE